MLKLIKFLVGSLAVSFFCLGLFYIIRLERNQDVYSPATLERREETQQNPKRENVNLLFVGDIMLDRGVASHAEKYGVDSLFLKVEQLFQNNDAVIGNLEGTITDNPSIATKDRSILRFTFNPLFAELIARLHFTALSLANNHSSDFEREGYEQTINNLRKAGIIYFGSSQNDHNLSANIIVRDQNICLIGYHDLFTFNQKPVIEEIKKVREVCSYIVLYTHWGDEYNTLPNKRQQKLAHEFIDSGADLIIGSHPHVIQTIEIYKNKAIFYSLGNFIFDQDFSLATKRGLAVRVELDDSRTLFSLVPISIEQGEVSIADLEEWAVILSALVDDNLPNDIASSIVYSQRFVLEK